MRRGSQAGGIGRGGLLRRLKAAALLALAALSSFAGSAALAQEAAEVVLVSGPVRVVHAPRQAALARELAAAARTPFLLPGLGRRPAPDSTIIILASSPAAFRQATGGGAPEWAGGVAIPDLRMIVLPGYTTSAVRQAEASVLLRHEIAHLVVAETLPEPVPRWFQEGYAEVASGGWDVESAWQLRLALMLGGAPPLDSLALGWPAGAERARFAYLLSATAVDYMVRRGGERGMELFFRNWREEGTFEGAMRVTFGLTVGQFEDEWRKDVKSRYGWLLALSNLGVVWLAAALLALAMWIPRRRRNRLRMDEMRKEERMLPPPREDGLDIQYPLPEPRD